jgi:AmmeMemoRadiSam system protein B
MKREPSVAGTFYPASVEALKRQIGSMVDKDAVKEKVKAVVSPHAGYVYSGPVAGELFSHIDITDTIIILGPNHTGLGPVFSLYKGDNWYTPLGEISVDTVLCSVISKGAKSIKLDENAHIQEHSIEVQLPFIQYFKKAFKIVPIVIGHANLSLYREVAKAIADAIKEYRQDVLIVASSDMTHYEPQDEAQRKDRIAIDAILKLDEELLLKKVEECNISMCGYAPTVVMLIAVKSLGAKSAKLIKYQTSGDTSGDYSAVVGYAGIIIK